MDAAFEVVDSGFVVFVFVVDVRLNVNAVSSCCGFPADEDDDDDDDNGNRAAS